MSVTVLLCHPSHSCVYQTTNLVIRILDRQNVFLLPDNYGQILTLERRFFVGNVSGSGAYRPARLLRVEGTGKVFAVRVPGGRVSKKYQQ